MRIGHYADGLWLNGGIASYIRRISEAQREAGHEIFYFDTAAPGQGKNPFPEATDIVADAEALFPRAAEHRLDVLHLHSILQGAAQPTVPTVRTLHGHEPYCPSGSRFLQHQGQPCNRNYSLAGCAWGHYVDGCGSTRPNLVLAGFKRMWQERATLRKIPVIAVSHFIREQMLRAGFDAKQVHVLHLFAPREPLGAPVAAPGPPRFVFLGRLTPHKGVHWLLRSMAAARETFCLDIAGDGYQEPELRKLAAQLGVQDRVCFHGWIPKEAVQNLLVNARALVFPSLWHEPGGTVAFEAMVNGKAVVMSRVGGMPEVVHDGENGLLAAPNDIPGLARALDRLSADPELACRLGRTGLEQATKLFTLENHLEALMRLYRTCGETTL